MDLSDIRKEYMLRAMNENQINRDPLKQFELWLKEAFEVNSNEPTAMVLATATPDGFPSARIVLLKALSDRGFGFFTNYSSRKSGDIALNKNVALLFHWPELERQIRIEGIATRTSGAESDEYFNSRPFGSRLSAVISNQSQVVPDREYLERLWTGHKNDVGDNDIVRPPYWGGYVVEPIRIEFWQGRSDRLHDRILFSRNGAGWVISRLAP